MTDEEAVAAAAVAQNPNIKTSLPPLPPEAQVWLKNFSPGLFDSYQQIESTWNHPLTQFSVTLVRDPDFRGAMNEIGQKFQKSEVLGYELLWILVIWILRAVRLGKAGTWLTRIWIQAWVSMLFWWGSLFLIPWILWGKAYRMVLATVFRALIHQFWA